MLGKLLIRYGVDTSELDKAEGHMKGSMSRVGNHAMSIGKMIMSAAGLGSLIYVGTNGFLDEYPASAIGSFEEQFYAFLDNKHGDILKAIKDSGQIEADTEKKLKDAIAEFKKIFIAEE